MKRLTCPYCKRSFRPHPRVGNRQKTCGKPSCKKTRKAENNRRWRRDNPDCCQNDYPRVKEWLGQHPHKSINKNQILNLLDLTFVNQKNNVILMGPPGTGKTHLALALGHQACLQGIKTLFTTAINLINHLSASLADQSFLKTMKLFTSPRLLIID